MFKSLVTCALAFTLLQAQLNTVLASPHGPSNFHLSRHTSRKPHQLMRRTTSNRNKTCSAIAASNKKFFDSQSQGSAAAVGGLSLSTPTSSSSGSCFPALGFQMPGSVPSSVNGWWCDPKTEYAFVGFGYEITACTSFVLSSFIFQLSSRPFDASTPHFASQTLHPYSTSSLPSFRYPNRPETC